MPKFPNFKQPGLKDCGPTCLKIIAKSYNKNISLENLRELSQTTRSGSSFVGLSDAAESIGFRSLGIRTKLSKLNEAPLPCILHWNKKHYVVLYKIKKNSFFISDPSYGLLEYEKNEFLQNWIGSNSNDQTEEGLALLLEPTPKFYNSTFEEEEQNFDIAFLSKYFIKYDTIPISV